MSVETGPEPVKRGSSLGVALGVVTTLLGTWVINDPELFMPDQKPFMLPIGDEGLMIDEVGTSILGGFVVVLGVSLTLLCKR